MKLVQVPLKISIAHFVTTLIFSEIVSLLLNSIVC
jgi:hypothetical protein